MSSSNEQLVQQLSTSDTPADAVQQTVQELEATEEGRAWLEATANLEKAFKHRRVISAATPVMPTAMIEQTLLINNNSASGNFYSIPIPFISKVGIEINSDNAKKKFEIKDKYWWPAAVGAQAGTLYYDNINDLSGESACRVSSVGPWFGVWFARHKDDDDVARPPGQKHSYAAFQAGNVGVAIPDVFWLQGGKWSSI